MDDQFDKRNGNNELKCIRCEKEAGLYQCNSCSGNTLLCRYCDHYIHSFNSKRDHDRFFVGGNSPNRQIENELKRYH